MNYSLERMKKLRELLIPEEAQRYLTAPDIAGQQESRLRLEELHLEYQERQRKVTSMSLVKIRMASDRGVI